MRNIIETERLRLINCDEEIIHAILESDEAISTLLQVNVASPWSEAGEAAFRFSLEKISSFPDEKIWWTYLPILKSENKLIGSGGYKGKPDENGIVEFGYEIAVAYRNRGLATEMAKGLIQFAFKSDLVQVVMAHTLAEENASVKVLRKCGLQFINEENDDEAGKVWRWEMGRIDKMT
ncbi:MAG: GNAT family N-acetyltransferase [Chitinophagales bacterium]